MAELLCHCRVVRRCADGLRFVFLSLIAGRKLPHGGAHAGDTFATPTIVHFEAVLGLSGILTAPWDGIRPAAIPWKVMGISAVVYAAIVIRRMRPQATPQFEDWLFDAALPFAAY